MTSNRDYSFLNFLFFCILLQGSILNCNASSQDCLEPKFEAQQKITVDLFYGYDAGRSVEDALCKIVQGSNGLISIAYRMGADMVVDSNGKVTCNSDERCLTGRRFACYYKDYKDSFSCAVTILPTIDGKIADCVCEGSADDIIIANRNDYVKSQATVLPALVVNQVFYPCYTYYSFEDLKAFFCKGYNNALPVCSQ